MIVEYGDFHTIVNGAKDEEIRMRLTKAVWGTLAARRDQRQEISAKTVITRTIKNHRQLFEAIDSQNEEEIRNMIKKNPRPDVRYAFMIVGIKTAVNSKITTNTQLYSQFELGMKVELTKALEAAGIPVPTDVDIDLSGFAGKLGGVFTNFSAKGERIFAVQYRLISIQKRLFAKDQTKYGDLAQLSESTGIYGGEEELAAGEVVTNGQGENNEKNDEEELGIGDYLAESQPEPEGIYFIDILADVAFVLALV